MKRFGITWIRSHAQFPRTKRCGETAARAARPLRESRASPTTLSDREAGVVVSHEGSWRADEGDNQPGIYMRAAPAEGMTFEQDVAPGVAEDESTDLAREGPLDLISY